MSNVIGGSHLLKAGLPSDRSQIDFIIEEASKDSRFYKHRKNHEAKIKDKISKLHTKMNFDLKQKDFDQAQETVDLFVSNLLELTLDSPTRYYVQIDMDAFFASVECLDHPEWKTIPMAVGSNQMLSTANYPARKFGITSAMPGFIAKKLCPELLIVPHNFPKYQQASEQMKNIVKNYDSNFRSFSLDEVSIDITDYLQKSTINTNFNDSTCNDSNLDNSTCNDSIFSNSIDDPNSISSPPFESSPIQDCSQGKIIEIVEQIRKEIFNATNGLTCSAGIATSRPLAKMCSNVNKPDGLYCPSIDDKSKIMEFLHEQPVEKLFGVGRVTAQILRELLEVKTVKDLWNKRYHVHLLFSRRQYEFLITCCLGLNLEGIKGSNHEISPFLSFGNQNDAADGLNNQNSSSSSSFNSNSNSQKSRSVERTVMKAITNLESANLLLRELSEILGRDLENENLCGQIIGIKIKTINFDTFTRVRKMGKWIWSISELYIESEKLLKKEFKREGNLSIRLLGLKLDHLQFRHVINDGQYVTMDKFIETKDNKNNKSNDASFPFRLDSSKVFSCPNCTRTFDIHENLFVINEHIDKCLENGNGNEKGKSNGNSNINSINLILPSPINKNVSLKKSKKKFLISATIPPLGNLDKFLNKKLKN